MHLLDRLLFAIVLFAAIAVTARAQDECGTALDRATDLYERAAFGEVIAVLKPCLEKELSDEERWQGYRLLALSYLFLDDPLGADTAIRKMLEINPRYQPNPGRDPAELIRPLQSYGSFPRFYAGIKGGAALTIREITEHHVVSGNRDLERVPHFVIGSDVGLMFDLNATSDLSLATEILYSTRSFGYTAEPQMTLRTTYSERLTWLTLPLIVRFQFADWGFRPFVYGGYFVQKLLGATSDFTGTRIDPGIDSMVLGGEVSRDFVARGRRTTEDRRIGINHGALVGVGLFYPLGAGLLAIDLRYEHGLAEVARAESRFDDAESLLQFLHVDDEFRLRNVGLQIGYIYQFGFTIYRK